MKNSDNRKRNWTFLVYPESVYENWKEYLDNLFIPYVVSPLHEFDINDDGTLKKPHFHVLFCFEGKKSYDQICEICDEIKATRPFPVADKRKLIRYLVHIDNKDKYQYSPDDIINCTGEDIAKYFLPSEDEKLHILADICRFIEEYQITEFNSLENYIRDVKYNEWYYTLKCEKVFIDMKLRSYRNVLKSSSIHHQPCND